MRRRCRLDGASDDPDTGVLMLQLVIVIVTVLLVIPGLLYWAAIAARRHIGKAPSWISRPTGREATGEKIEPPGKA